jgi:asparagine synthase (glutamine-hydrolysing)
VTPDIDEQSLYHYLTFLTTPAPTTLFRGIQKLPAGHVLTLKRDGTLNIQRYWDALPPAHLPDASEAEHRAEILRLLRDSIRKRMMSDVPFGVFLSGGVDSSANVALMSELMTRPVDTFTVGFSDAEYLNELDSARRIAKQFATNHHEVIISEKEMHDFLPSLVFHQDEPIADPVCVPLYYVSKLARDSGTIVVQVGEGADEIFSGYENYVRHLRIYESFWRHAETLPRGLRRALSNLSRPALEATGRKRVAIELIRRLGADEPLFWGGAVVYDESFKPRVLSKQMRERMNGLSSLQVVEPYLNHIEHERPDSDFLARMTYLELKLRLPELLLMRVDKITMATSVEARVPFLDHHLVEYALALPRSLKVQGVTGKHILKRALEEILPHDLLYERKRGFGAPVREWFREGLGGWFDQHLMNSTMRRRDLLDYEFVGRMLDEHRNRTKDWGFHLWALLNLSLWYERWIDPA